MILSIIIVILLILYLLLALPFMLFALLIGIFLPKVRFAMAMMLTKIPANLFFLLAGTTCIVKGKENIPKNKAVLFVGNHKGYMDIPLLIKYAPMPLAFIAKESLKKVPLFNLIMIILGCLFIDRQDVRQSVEIIKKGIAKLVRGESLLIFPEGTRSKTGELLPFKQGSLKLAERSGCLIVPFALKGTDEVFGKHGFKVTKSTVWLTFGQPIQLSELSSEDQKKSAAYVQRIIQEMYDVMA